MVSCSGSLVQSCCREGGALQADIAVCGEHSPCSGHTGFAPAHGCLCFPRLCCSGSRMLYMEQALRCMRFQFLGTPQKHGLGWACILCLSCPSSSGSQELVRRTLPGCGVPYPLHGPCLSFCARQSGAPCVCSPERASNPPGGCRPSRISGSLWLEPGGLFAVWEGRLSLGLSLPLSPSPASCLLPPAGDGPVRRRLALLWSCSVSVLRMAGSVFGQVNFLSLLLYHSLSCCLTLVPSDCPQGIRPGPYPKQCCRLLSIPPPLAGGGCGCLGYFSAGSCF